MKYRKFIFEENVFYSTFFFNLKEFLGFHNIFYILFCRVEMSIIENHHIPIIDTPIPKIKES